jgi:hypothetical protein
MGTRWSVHTVLQLDRRNKFWCSIAQWGDYGYKKALYILLLNERILNVFTTNR